MGVGGELRPGAVVSVTNAYSAESTFPHGLLRSAHALLTATAVSGAGAMAVEIPRT